MTRGPDRRRGSGARALFGLLVVLLLGGGIAAVFFYLDSRQMRGAADDVDLGGGLTAGGGLDTGVAAPPPAKTRRRARLGQIRVKSTPPNAAIILCGLATGKVTPATVRVRLGRRCVLELQLERYESYKLPVIARRGKPINIVASLRRAAPPPGKGTRCPQPRAGGGTLRVTSIQMGTVFVDGKRVGRTPRLDLSLPPGIYSVKVYFSTLEQYTPTRQVTVRAGQTSTAHFDPS